ncbi:MAG: membrane-binding protein [Cyclobacteriaceae bacterium]
MPALATAQGIQGKRYFDSDSTKIREIFHFNTEDSTLQGSYESFHLNGSLQTFGWYENNLPDSVWNYFYENGRKKAVGRYTKGIPTAKWEYFYENGNKKSEGILQNNIKEGKWIFYFESGSEKSSGTYENDLKKGIWNYFYENESIKAQAFYEGEKATYKEFYPFGSVLMEGEIINERSEGEWIYYYEGGEIEAIGKFEEGLKSGQWIYYHKNGNKRALGNYVNGLRNGEWEYYHENGALSQSGLLERDQKEGYWKLFYPNGDLQGEVVFDQGSGEFSEYYTHGGKKSGGQLIDEKKEGKWVYYSENGRVEGEADFKNGEGDYQGYYPDGSLKMKGKIKDDKRVGEWTLYNPDGSLAGTYSPIYEDEKPIFKSRLSSDFSSQENDTFDKPEYKFKRRGLRYFQYRINEYRALILGTNPVWLVDNQLPIALEYYMQERLGYELQLDLIRDPFFTSNENIDNYTVFSRGSKINFRQKFYHEDGKYGMFYFGHQISYTYINHQVNHPDTLIFPTFPKYGNMIESGLSYGVFIGSRWMRDVGDSGWTIDAFLGISVAGRSYDRKFEPDPVINSYFDPKEQATLYFPVVFGINFGFAGPGNKSKTQ